MSASSKTWETPAPALESAHCRVPFLGYSVDSLSMDEAVAWVARAVQEPRLHHIAVINANKMWIANRNSRLQQIIQSADLVIPEYAVVWGCRVLGTPVAAHIGGIMLLQSLLPWLESEGVGVYFLGARLAVVETLVMRLKRQYPRLNVAGALSGYFPPEESNAVVEGINKSGASIAFVALGSPKQEFWIDNNREHLQVRVALGVGGSFDVLAGLKKDAPSWVRHGGEWLYRLAQDPRHLWKRYLTTNPWFVSQVLREKFMPCKMSKPTQTA